MKPLLEEASRAMRVEAKFCAQCGTGMGCTHTNPSSVDASQSFPSGHPMHNLLTQHGWQFSHGETEGYPAKKEDAEFHIYTHPTRSNETFALGSPLKYKDGNAWGYQRYSDDDDYTPEEEVMDTGHKSLDNFMKRKRPK